MSSSNIWIIGIIAGLIIGITLGYIYLQPELQSAQENETDLKTQVTNLENQVNEYFDVLVQSENNLMDAQAENRNLRALLNNETLTKEKINNLLSTTNFTLTETQKSLDQKKIELQEAEEETRFEKDQNARLNNQIILAENALNQLEADKKLLIELRKDMPLTRETAFQYWATIKDYAVDVDSSLSRKVDNVITSITPYFDWVDEQPGYNATLEEYTTWLLFPPQSATNYGITLEEFILDFYLQIIQDIDTAIESSN